MTDKTTAVTTPKTLADAEQAVEHAKGWVAEATTTALRRRSQLKLAEAETEAATEALLLAEHALQHAKEVGDRHADEH